MNWLTVPSLINENSLNFLQIGENEVQSFNNVVTYSSFLTITRSDGYSLALPQDIFEPFYFNSFRDIVAPVFNKSIANLLKVRGHLALQLDLECGNISEEYFDKEEKKYLSETNKITLKQLTEEVNLLYEFSKLPLDAEDISEMLNCSFDDAENVVKNYIGKGA